MIHLDIYCHFLPVDVYLRFKLICKDAVSREQENRILFFKNELFKE